MTNFLRAIASSNRRPIIGVVTLALLVLISVANLIVPNNTMWASGIAQDRVYKVREGNALDKVIEIDLYNINSPEFPKGFQIKIKNISKKPIYYILLDVHLPETEPLMLTPGGIWFPLRFGYSKLVDNSLRIDEIPESELEKHPLKSIKPGESALLGLDDEWAERVRNKIETQFPGDNPATKKLELSFQVINFGDGTGYLIGDPFQRDGQIGLGSPKEPTIPVLNAPISPKGFTASSPKPTFSFFSFLLSFLPKSGSSFFYLNSNQPQSPFHDSKLAVVILD